MNTTIQTVPFEVIKNQVRQKFDNMLKNGTVFAVEYDRDAIWQAYLDGFKDPVERQEHNCSCCRSFIRQIGPAVSITAELKIVSIWDKDSPSPGVRALAAYVESCPIGGLFFHESERGGTDKSPDPKKNVVWEHFFVQIPKTLVNDERRGNVLGRKSANLRETKQVMRRGFEGISEDALNTVLELIGQNSLYRGNDYKHMVEGFQQMRQSYLQCPAHLVDNLCWQLAPTAVENVARIRNTAIGTLLVDLSLGECIDRAVGAFERIVAPTNYKRPTALVTPRMVETAKARLGELGLMSALHRRRLDDRDLTAANALYVYRPTSTKKDIFAEIANDQPVSVKELQKVEEITIEDFLSKVVPTAKDIRVLVERNHLGNFVTLTGASDPEAANLMKWDNSYGWSYTGGLADSIKEKVKAAGGRVDGWMRVSLAWYNYDDLDLHFESSLDHVYYANKRTHQAWLDVDMNAGQGNSREPVENITFDRQLKPGSYQIKVVQFNRRETIDEGYDLEFEVNGETHSFGSNKSPRDQDVIKFKVLGDGQVTFDSSALSKTSSGTTKWGVKTGQFTRVRAIALSPNHWTKPIGNKHFMFMLEGCVSDEPTRPFYNEFLVDALSSDRKTMEVLGGKIEVDPAQGAELSGIGFSDTQRNHLYVEATGVFKRILKVLF